MVDQRTRDELVMDRLRDELAKDLEEADRCLARLTADVQRLLPGLRVRRGSRGLPTEAPSGAEG
jgi:hypothetical protein